MATGPQRRLLLPFVARILAAAWASAALLCCNALWGVDGLSYDRSATGGATTLSGGGDPVGGGGGSGGVGGSGGSGGSTAAGGHAGAGGGGGAPPLFCEAAALIACYPFEGDAADGTGNGHDASAQNVTYVQGEEGLAVELDATSLVQIPASDSFTSSALTIEVWLRLAELPAPGYRMGIVDYNSRWGLWIDDQGVRCTVSGYADMTGPQLTVGLWQHVACTIDGTARGLYLDGVSVDSANGAIITPTPTGEPLTIGSNAPSGDALIGRIDQLRIFGAARSAAQICEAAGCSR
jgi:hypothetical protein